MTCAVNPAARLFDPNPRCATPPHTQPEQTSLTSQSSTFVHSSLNGRRCKLRKARLAGRGRASSALMCHRPAGVPPTSFKRPGLFVVPPTGNHNLQEHQIPLGSSGRGGLRSSISFGAWHLTWRVILAQLGLSLPPGVAADCALCPVSSWTGCERR
jgi:hypothetical protein